MSTMHPGDAVRRNTRNAHRDYERGGDQQQTPMRVDYSLLEAPVWGEGGPPTPEARTLRLRQRRSFHELAPAARREYLADLDQRNDEAWDVAELCGRPRAPRPVRVAAHSVSR